MKNAITKHRVNTVLVSNVPIEIGVNRHFNSLERKILDKKNYTDDLFETDVNCYRNYEKLTKKEKNYAFKLAFFQRIQLKLEDSFQSPVSFENYPIELFENFTKADELFEKHFDSFEKEKANLPDYRFKYKKRVIQAIFKFWLCGYGILKGYNEKTIGDNEINYVFHRVKGQKKLGRLLATMFIGESLSPVSLIPVTKEKLSIPDSENAKWTELLKENNCEIGQQLFDFTFEVLTERAKGGYILTYIDGNGSRRRMAYDEIRWGTFLGYSGALIRATKILYQSECYTVEQALKGGIINIFTTNTYKNLDETMQDNIKTVLRIWLEVYSKLNDINLNINRIIPMNVSNNTRTYSKILDFGSTHTLISTILDDQSDLFDENKLFDLRARRACLIQLETGKRISEVLLLKRDCLKRDAEGKVWIHFHKTKNGEPHYLPASKHAVKWIKQLKKMSPETKITVSSDKTPWGDDETDYRLFANIHNDSIMAISSINKFLKGIQEKLWSIIDDSSYYSSHDLRRMNAVYMKMKGKSPEDIQEQLGQLDISSQLPYLETKPPEIQSYFRKIAEEGIWSHLSSTAEDGIPLQQVLKRSQKQGITSDTTESAKMFLEDIIEQVEIQKRKLPLNTDKQPVSTGFPMRTHNCLATEIVNCGHTELHCFSCKRYLPDSDKLEEHKAEVFRYILLLAHNDDKGKQNKLERDLIVIRSENIKNLLDETFQNLFKKFKLSPKEIKAIEKDLYLKAKTYYRKQKKDKPTLTFQEALLYLRTGVINGKK